MDPKRQILNELGNHKEELKEIKYDKSKPVQERLDASKENMNTSVTLNDIMYPQPKDL